MLEESTNQFSIVMVLGNSSSEPLHELILETQAKVVNKHRDASCSECVMGTCRRILFAELNMLTWNGKEQVFRSFARDLVNSSSKFRDGRWSETIADETTWPANTSFASEKQSCCK